jgi:hypothetical protein
VENTIIWSIFILIYLLIGFGFATQDIALWKNEDDVQWPMDFGEWFRFVIVLIYLMVIWPHYLGAGLYAASKYTKTKLFQMKRDSPEVESLIRIEEKLQPMEMIAEEIYDIEHKIRDISDTLTFEYPAWGEGSPYQKKIDSEIQLYASDIAAKENISKAEAHCKAEYIYYNYNREIISHDNKISITWDKQRKSKKAFVNSKLFNKEVEQQMKNLKSEELFEALWVAIEKDNAQKYSILGVKLNEHRGGKYQGSDGHKTFVHDTAIVEKLFELGLLKLHEECTPNQKLYDLTEFDFEKICQIVFAEEGCTPEYCQTLQSGFFGEYENYRRNTYILKIGFL